MRSGNGFNSTSHSRMNSSAITVRNQGGGPSKAGFAHTIGRDHWTSIAMKAGNNAAVNKRCAGLPCLILPISNTTCESRPIGSVGTFPRFKCSGLPR